MRNHSKNNPKDLILQALSMILPGILVFILVALSFSQFLSESKESTLERNESYLKDFTLSVATKLNEKFDTAINSVAAVAKMNADRLLNDDNIAEVLADIEAETQFDHVRYVDVTGTSHTSAGTTADVSDRVYFTEGMKGNKGSTFITNSRLTNQRQIGFYAPLPYNGQLCGVIVAFYDEKSLVGSIDYDFYGEKASVGIISTEGKMIINSPSEYMTELYSNGFSEDICDLLDTDFIDADNSRKIEKAYQNLSETDFEVHYNGVSTIGYMAPISNVNLNVYMTFPSAANTAMYENGIAAGRTLETRLIIIFVVLIAYVFGLFLIKLYRGSQIQKKLIITSNTDELTGLYNRNAYESACQLNEGTELPEDLIFAIYDVNGLKSVNDTLGHEAGDEIIIGAAKVFQECLGPYGKVFRIGGDEFAAILHMNPEELPQLQEKVEAGIAAWSGRLVEHLYVSSGYVSATEVPDAELRKIAHLADERMYAAKSAFYQKQGRDRRKR